MQPLLLDDGREPSESDATCQATEDEDYYFHLVTFEVEDRLFRVPSYQFFKASRMFSTTYKLSARVTADDGDPIKLEMINQKDFRSFLKVLYPLSLPVMKLSLSKEEWISVLTLASSWAFPCVREIAKVALEYLGSLTSLEKIYVGRGAYIDSWLIDGLVGLVHATTITDEEALKIDSGLGAQTTAYKLFRIRELRIAGELISARTKVEETFKEQLDSLRIWEELMFGRGTKKKLANLKETIIRKIST